MSSAKKLGYKKGDFVYTGAFPGILIGDVHTTTPLCEVWGIEHECGGCYASDLRRLTFTEFKAMVQQYNPGAIIEADTQEAKLAIAKAELEASK